MDTESILLLIRISRQASVTGICLHKQVLEIKVFFRNLFFSISLQTALFRNLFDGSQCIRLKWTSAGVKSNLVRYMHILHRAQWSILRALKPIKMSLVIIKRILLTSILSLHRSIFPFFLSLPLHSMRKLQARTRIALTFTEKLLKVFDDIWR